jgi:hypothetical protein
VAVKAVMSDNWHNPDLNSNTNPDLSLDDEAAMIDEEEEIFNDDDAAEDEEEDGFVHLGYYVRRVEGSLVLVQTFLIQHEDQSQSDIQTAYIEMGDLEPSWIDAVHEQGQHLIEGKSVDFVPPDEDDDFDDLDEALLEDD